jgi:uncharacterized phage protein (TIGR01671 family)
MNSISITKIYLRRIEMRELKFRAWVGSENTDRVDEEMHFEYGLCLLQGKYADADAFGEIYGTYEDVPVEQYTGLKDKNGKEIYEGDIISFENEKGLARVLWLDKKAMFGLKWLDCGVEDELDYWTVCKGTVEVIGNIHENPGLLE